MSGHHVTDKGSCVSEHLSDQAREFSFFQAVYLLEQHFRADPNSEFGYVGEGLYANQERVHFTISPELGFPSADINSIEAIERDGVSGAEIEVNFLGLHGASSPLPTSYTEKLAGRGDDDNPVRDFFDFFHNRYLSLFYRIWRKNQYAVTYESGATDALSKTLYNLLGVSSEAGVQDQMHLDWAKLLSYLGQLSNPTRSADLVAGIVGHCFGLDDVTIEEWVLRKINIPLDQQTRLGRANHQLGETSHLGSKVMDINGKFNLRIGELDFVRYKAFYKDSQAYNELLELMEFILLDPLSWDLKLEVDSTTIPTNSLGQAGVSELGKSIWLGKPLNDIEVVMVPGVTE
ncbi:type VI secretion system baseplate subunit TssG [Vibrio sp. WXL103]|uniref:type VI secretion system baseplate subunit TssG n=1 Tax=Vibrio sp. WXL103 TaxID=3450710 RepID=UPI003EC8C23C